MASGSRVTGCHRQLDRAWTISDHGVNIKILLSQVVRDGDLTLKQRNEILLDDGR